MDMSKLQQLAAMLRATPPSGQMPPQGMQPPLGAGMAQQAAQQMQNRPYQMHVQEAQALGQTPMTPQQFMAQQQGQ